MTIFKLQPGKKVTYSNSKPNQNSCQFVSMVIYSCSAVNVTQGPLCQYREAVFRNGALCRPVEKVQAISDDITDRNKKLELPYEYMSPDRIENSMAI